MKTCFLLFDGQSVDGRGDPKYIGRTEDRNIAYKHSEKCRHNQYSTGKVIIVTDTEFHQVCPQTNWKKY